MAGTSLNPATTPHEKPNSGKTAEPTGDGPQDSLDAAEKLALGILQKLQALLRILRLYRALALGLFNNSHFVGSNLTLDQLFNHVTSTGTTRCNRQDSNRPNYNWTRHHSRHWLGASTTIQPN